MIALALAALGLSAAAAPADTLEIREWQVPWEQTRPRDPTVAPDGRIWFVGQTGDYVGWFDTETAEFGRHPLPDGTGPHNVVAATINALQNLHDPGEVAKRRDISVSRVFNG